MYSMARALLVTCATGQPGETLLSVSLKANVDFEIIGLTRNAQSASTQKLQARSLNIKLVIGDLNATGSGGAFGVASLRALAYACFCRRSR
jgi:DNA-binding NarL/FixJ family response regulator